MINILSATAPHIQRAAHAIRAGQLVAFPTETVYGLGADACNDQAVASIFKAKGRPQFNPMITHVKDIAQAEPLAHLSPEAEALMLHFWPHALTLVLPRRSTSPVSLLCNAGMDKTALRCPNHPVALALIEAAGCPIVAPSANRSGKISPTTAQHVAASFAEEGSALIQCILAAGRCTVGLESTVLDLSTPTPQLIRAGAVLVEELEHVIGRPIIVHAGNPQQPTAPGQLLSHYAPHAAVQLNVKHPDKDDAYLAFGQTRGVEQPLMLNLSPDGDLTEAAANLFAYLHQLDAAHPTRISVAPIPHVGLGIAINDRLTRAAAPREA